MDYAKEGSFVLDGQNIVVDHLVKIIQAIQIGRTTGSLIATRGEGASYELGTLMFLNGRVVQARVGRREGREAFNWLSTWGRCRYTFVLSITSESAVENLSGGNQDQFIQEEGKASPGDSEQVNETVPYRSKPLEYGLRVLSEKSLSRTHRHVFLLVNGARSVVELTRLLKRNENEVLALLYDLQDTGVISLPIPLSL
jgi:hypothetical protein